MISMKTEPSWIFHSIQDTQNQNNNLMCTDTKYCHSFGRWWPSLLTSFGSSEMKSLWNWGSMTCIMCRTWVGSQIWISSSTAIRRSALLHIYRTKFTLLRHLPPTSIFSYQFWYSINKIVTNINNYTWNVCSHSMSLGGGCSLDGILGRWPPA